MAITNAMKKAIESNGMQVFGSLVRVGGTLYPLPLVKGNSKLGKSVWHASTVPTTQTVTATFNGVTVSEKGTCPMDCKGCYGTANNYKYESTKYYLIMRTKLLREHMREYFILVNIQLTFERIAILRIHATGDFIDGEASGFRDVLLKHPNVKAWTYTKRNIDGEIAELDSLPNCNIVKSIIKGFGFNYGHVPYIASLYYALKRMGKSVHICRCGVDKEQHCTDCTGCADNEYVLFVEHSTGYKPEKDYGWDKFVALVNGQ